MIPRLLLKEGEDPVTPGKVLVLYGARQVGKTTLVRTYLQGSPTKFFKDILALERVKGASILLALIRLVAHQIGKEVSLNELAAALGIAKQTVERYLDLLEKTFVLVRVGGYSGNLRNAVTKTARYYFGDNGIRNAVIRNFNSLEFRDDIGALWENYLVMERWKNQEGPWLPMSSSGHPNR